MISCLFITNSQSRLDHVRYGFFQCNMTTFPIHTHEICFIQRNTILSKIWQVGFQSVYSWNPIALRNPISPLHLYTCDNQLRQNDTIYQETKCSVTVYLYMQRGISTNITCYKLMQGGNERSNAIFYVNILNGTNEASNWVSV